MNKKGDDLTALAEQMTAGQAAVLKLVQSTQGQSATSDTTDNKNADGKDPAIDNAVTDNADRSSTSSDGQAGDQEKSAAEKKEQERQNRKSEAAKREQERQRLAKEKEKQLQEQRTQELAENNWQTCPFKVHAKRIELLDKVYYRARGSKDPFMGNKQQFYDQGYALLESMYADLVKQILQEQAE